MTKTIMLAAGGTGGHFFPAQSLADELLARGHTVQFLTDPRGLSFQEKSNTQIPIHTLAIHRGTSRIWPFVLGISLTKSLWQCLKLFRKKPPSCVVGFGGYPSISAVLAAQMMGIPTVIHEQNAVLGRTNRLLSHGVQQIATSFQTVQRLPKRAQVTVTGNPVRTNIQAVRPHLYTCPDTVFRILILGGSQGAELFSTALPQLLCALPKSYTRRLEITQNARVSLIQSTQKMYVNAGIKANVQPFITDMDQQLKKAHLVIARSGASTIAELAVVGRPAIFFPYPYATDRHQHLNASIVVDHGGGWLCSDVGAGLNQLKPLLIQLMDTPELLAESAKKMAQLAHLDAAQALADLVLSSELL